LQGGENLVATLPETFRGMTRFDRTAAKTKRAQALRSDMPRAERKLWAKLKNKQLGGFRFRCQHPIGPYFLDFYCPDVKLFVELDGGQHTLDAALIHDAKRTAFLENNDICVLRFWNAEVVENLNGVVTAILDQAMNLKREIEILRDKSSSP
jgi:very-short-patch-repair endonuclease